MKRLITFLMALLVSTNVYAANQKVVIDKLPTSKTPVSASLLDNSPTSVTSSAINVSGYSRVGFYVTYDETQVGNSVSGAFTVEMSPDNVTWFTAPFFDTAGGATPQTSETISADGSYVAWTDRNIPFNYIRVKVTGTNTDADDTILTSVYVYMDR